MNIVDDIYVKIMSGNSYFDMVKPLWKGRLGGVQNGRTNGLLWYKDLGYHVSGEFSMAVVQANNLLEDQSQVESGQLGSSGLYGTFIGIYDGHGGPETSRFVNEKLFSNLKSTLPLHIKTFVFDSINGSL